MIELLIVALLVIWSAVVVFKKVFPKTAYTVLLRLAEACQRRGWRTPAQWFRPKTLPGGCGGSCGCDQSPDATAAKTEEVKPVQWR